MMQRFEHLFRRDFWMKVLALALAVLMWNMVVLDYNKETTIPFDVPLEVKHHPTLEMFEGPQDQERRVEVQVTGPNLLVSSLSVDDFRAWLDYGRVTEANRAQQVDVQVQLPARIREQVKYRVLPSTFEVTLVQNRTASVPLVVRQAVGVVSVGDREFRYTAAPELKSVDIRGRSDALNLVRKGQITLEQGDLIPPLESGVLRENVSTVSKVVQPLDATDNPVDKLAQHYANVILTWEELPPGKTVSVEPMVQGTLPPGFELVGVAVGPDLITLRSGAVDGRLPAVSVVQTEPVDLTGQTKTFTTAARIVTPPGTNAAVTSVNVTVTIAETRVEKVFGAIPVEVQGQEATVDVALPVPTVQVRLTGPYTLMQPMDAGAVRVFVEIDNLPEGSHRLPVKMDPIPGVPEVAVDPAIVEVVITNR